MSSTMSRRTFTAGTVGSLAALLSGGALLSLPSLKVLAQATDLASLGYSTLDITVTTDSFTNAPTELKAGRYLLTVTVGEGVDMGSVSFVAPPAGTSAEDFLNTTVLPLFAPPASPEAAASPAAGGGGEQEFVLPSAVYQAHFAGGAYAMPNMPGQAVVDLGPGEWILIGDDPRASPQTPAVFTVTGEMPADLAEPPADITVTFIDFGINVEGTLTAGDHILKLQNNGAQPHFLFLAKGPDSMTNDQIAEILTMEMGGPSASPSALPFDPEKDLMPVFNSVTQSIGTAQWVTVSLEAGTYAAMCFFPTAGEGLPHAFHGMHTVFKVS